MTRPPVAGDLFCGAGGFSEGFRQAGFKIRWAFDNWKPAYETYRNNFPQTDVVTDDILSFDFRKAARRLGPIDVLIGSPPCQPFSLANKGGNGDAMRGLAPVAKFLEAVKALKPKFWIMENVPNIQYTLNQAWLVDPKNFTESEMRTYFPPHSMKTLDSSLFGVPQKRKRLFSGSFPLPAQSTEPIVPMLHVIKSFPYPKPLPLGSRTGTVTDPLYKVRIRKADLRDHFIESEMDWHHVEMSRREKRRHRWAGKMKFPDDLQSPSRTICATSVKSGRQAIVIRDPRKPKVFRTPTVRECASLQGFPITYQFSGSTLTERQTLVGNAVPPPVARALAIAMIREMGLNPPTEPLLFNRASLAPELRNGHGGRTHRFTLLRPYKSQVPGTYASCRVDLDNQGGTPRKHPCGTGRHLREWRAVLYLGYAKEYVAYELDLDTAMKLARAVLESTETLDSHLPESAENRVLRKTVDELGGEVPDASTLQAIWADRLDHRHGPDWVLDSIGEICQSVVGKPTRRAGVEAGVFASYLRGRRPVSHGKDSESGKWRSEPVNAYTACAAVALSAVALLVNDGVEWLKTNWGRHYSDLSISTFDSFPERLLEARDSNLFGEKAVP